jgi:hypothetical protein
MAGADVQVHLQRERTPVLPVVDVADAEPGMDVARLAGPGVQWEI